MSVSLITHTLFHWLGMLAAVGIVLVMPWAWLNPGSHGQTMGGAIGVALAPILFWLVLEAAVIVAMLVSCTASHIAEIPDEARKPCWLPFAVSVATSATFWVMNLLIRR